MARILGYDRESAARLSFLLALPLVAGAAVFEAVRLRNAALPARFGVIVASGAISAAVTALTAVWGLIGVVRRRSFAPFVAYRVGVGAAVLAIAGLGWR